MLPFHMVYLVWLGISYCLSCSFSLVEAAQSVSQTVSAHLLVTGIRAVPHPPEAYFKDLDLSLARISQSENNTTISSPSLHDWIGRLVVSQARGTAVCA